MKLLIVDDNVDILSGVTDYLSAVHTVVSFDDPLCALDYMKYHPVDLLIPDYEMPGISGLQLAEAAADIIPALPVIAMTGASDVSQLKRSAYIQHVLHKPFLPSKLAALVQSFAVELITK